MAESEQFETVDSWAALEAAYQQLRLRYDIAADELTRARKTIAEIDAALIARIKRERAEQSKVPF
mgnify:FL=1